MQWQLGTTTEISQYSSETVYEMPSGGYWELLHYTYYSNTINTAPWWAVALLLNPIQYVACTQTT